MVTATYAVSTAELIRQLRGADGDSGDGCHDQWRRDDLHRQLVDRYAWLVQWAVARYRDRGEQADELTQVGYLGLVEAMQRFDPDRGVDFVYFARPTILGEIRRHFRDRRRWVRLPRRIQELKLQLRQAGDELCQNLGHDPSPAELADHLDVAEAEVVEALEVDDGFAPLSLDAPLHDADGAAFLDQLAVEDHDLTEIADSNSLWPVLEQLPARERQIILLRFFGNKTQQEIGRRLGISQMHVSRLLDQTLRKLRANLAA